MLTIKAPTLESWCFDCWNFIKGESEWSSGFVLKYFPECCPTLKA